MCESIHAGDQGHPKKTTAEMQGVNLFHYRTGWTIPKQCQAAERHKMRMQAPSGSVQTFIFVRRKAQDSGCFSLN